MDSPLICRFVGSWFPTLSIIIHYEPFVRPRHQPLLTTITHYSPLLLITINHYYVTIINHYKYSSLYISHFSNLDIHLSIPSWDGIQGDSPWLRVQEPQLQCRWDSCAVKSRLRPLVKQKKSWGNRI